MGKFKQRAIQLAYELEVSERSRVEATNRLLRERDAHAVTLKSLAYERQQASQERVRHGDATSDAHKARQLLYKALGANDEPQGPALDAAGYGLDAPAVPTSILKLAERAVYRLGALNELVREAKEMLAEARQEIANGIHALNNEREARKLAEVARDAMDAGRRYYTPNVWYGEASGINWNALMEVMPWARQAPDPRVKLGDLLERHTSDGKGGFVGHVEHRDIFELVHYHGIGQPGDAAKVREWMLEAGYVRLRKADGCTVYIHGDRCGQRLLRCVARQVLADMTEESGRFDGISGYREYTRRVPSALESKLEGWSTMKRTGRAMYEWDGDCFRLPGYTLVASGLAQWQRLNS